MLQPNVSRHEPLKNHVTLDLWKGKSQKKYSRTQLVHEIAGEDITFLSGDRQAFRPAIDFSRGHDPKHQTQNS
jgi:hypothetical protein